MNNERSFIIESLRAEIIGPSILQDNCKIVAIEGGSLIQPEGGFTGPLVWKPDDSGAAQEVIYFQRETPGANYGSGVLYPDGEIEDGGAIAPISELMSDVAGPNQQSISVGARSNIEDDDQSDADDEGETDDDEPKPSGAQDDDFDVTSSDVRRPSTFSLTFCASVPKGGQVEIALPSERRFSWQKNDSTPIQLNGSYQKIPIRSGATTISSRAAWFRRQISCKTISLSFTSEELHAKRQLSKPVHIADVNVPLRLEVSLYARPYELSGGNGENWIITAVLRNVAKTTKEMTRDDLMSHTLFQTYFEVRVEGGKLLPYPESRRFEAEMDDDEKSLALLYSNSQTWAIGHGCAAAWDAEPGETPDYIYADCMPAVELPSMTPDIVVGGQKLEVTMRSMAELDSTPSSRPAWDLLHGLIDGYREWISSREQSVLSMQGVRKMTAERHLKACRVSADRMEKGLALLRRSDGLALEAFKLANLAMLLQQIASKGLKPRPLAYNIERNTVNPQGVFLDPWELYKSRCEEESSYGKWRAFQLAFLLMSLPSISDPLDEDRETVDLIWFPTGGGKTEAYLGVMAYMMFYQRLTKQVNDGTCAIMRYTLRMLTTQQFQRASSLICAMEFLRREYKCRDNFEILGAPFSIGLWLGGSGSPNTIKAADKAIKMYKSRKVQGNPMVLTECPWCRSAIGIPDGEKPKKFKGNNIAGISPSEGKPLLNCSDARCEFGRQDPKYWLPVHVIDELIYSVRPSLVIATADKLAMIAHKPEAGSLFGIDHSIPGSPPKRISPPPSLIIQDELHLISGPLGTMYGLYEAIFEKLCTHEFDGVSSKPKIIASTATIRGASQQVRSVYGRTRTTLFPSPGLDMADSFFGAYARHADGKLKQGRLYLGIHANGYGSSLTAQVRAYSRALFAPAFIADPVKRDPWWTFIGFYNSIRELGGAKTLFDSDIHQRLNYLFWRDAVPAGGRRDVRGTEELTSRLSQAEIVQVMDRLGKSYNEDPARCISSCLASNIIEVGVDIDRLSLMAITGQPKSTSSYIQISGRVGRRWADRPGLILMMYSPSKSRDRSHFEQFHSYHRRLYERVEPTTATPFAISALKRGMSGAVFAWARQRCSDKVGSSSYVKYVQEAVALLKVRSAGLLDSDEDRRRADLVIDEIFADIVSRIGKNPNSWGRLPPDPDGEYLILWPGVFYTDKQKSMGVYVPTSMRQVDTTSELGIPTK
jgi:Helicase conserved C-terminal domain